MYKLKVIRPANLSRWWLVTVPRHTGKRRSIYFEMTHPRCVIQLHSICWIQSYTIYKVGVNRLHVSAY
jgi:hypothetical protein